MATTFIKLVGACHVFNNSFNLTDLCFLVAFKKGWLPFNFKLCRVSILMLFFNIKDVFKTKFHQDLLVCYFGVVVLCIKHFC